MSVNNNRLQNFTSFFPYFSALPLHPSLPPTPPSPLHFLFLPLSPSLSFSLPLRGRHNSLGLERHLCRSGSNKGKSPCAGALQLQKRAVYESEVPLGWAKKPLTIPANCPQSRPFRGKGCADLLPAAVQVQEERPLLGKAAARGDDCWAGHTFSSVWTRLPFP